MNIGLQDRRFFILVNMIFSALWSVLVKYASLRLNAWPRLLWWRGCCSPANEKVREKTKVSHVRYCRLFWFRAN